MLMTIFGILILVMALFLVITILMQSSRDHRLSGTIAGGAETFFGKQKGKTMDGVLNKITIVVCIVFFVCVLLMYIFQGANTSNNNVNGDNTIDLSDYTDGTTDDTNGDAAANDETANGDENADAATGENGENTENTENTSDVDEVPDGTGDSDKIGGDEGTVEAGNNTEDTAGADDNTSDIDAPEK